MSTEQKLGASPDPEYPYTLVNLREATESPNDPQSNTRLKRKIDKDTSIAPLTDIRGRVWLSEEDFKRVVDTINEKKEKPTSLLNGSTKISSKSSRKQQDKETSRRASEKNITLPNNDIIPLTKSTITTDIIKGILHAQENNSFYTEIDASSKGSSRFYTGRGWIESVIERANKKLKPHHFQLISDEIEAEGGKIRVLKIIEEEPIFTSSPER